MSDAWYKNAIIYQVYPRSFADASGDGIGDLVGITDKLDYLQDLGVTAIWLSPIYRSPMADFGYDVSDYKDIDPIFGSLDDFDGLVASAHRRNIKVLMDLIPNHTSDQHPWFEEARASHDNPKRHWYIWKDPKPDGSPPNNWQSIFGGPAWTYDPKTAQYYLHSFLKEQPDLNWSNPEVHRAIQDIMRFWYKRGVDGFRVDAILFTSKDLEFRDNPEPKAKHDDIITNEVETAFSYGVGEHLPEYIRVLTDVTNEFPDHCIFLEAYPEDGSPAGYAHLYDSIDHSVAAPFYFGLFGATYDWRAETFARSADEFQAHLPDQAFPAYVLGNHDMARLATRIGYPAARAACIALLALPGAKFIYYGDELGMEDVPIPTQLLQDPSTVSRDPERTPMRWTPGPHAGFSQVEPWLPVGPEGTTRNVQVMLEDELSILNLYRQMISLYHAHPALYSGAFEPLNLGNPAIYGFKRIEDEEQLLILVNFSGKTTTVEVGSNTGTLLLSSTLTHAGKHGKLMHVSLEANEAVVIKLDNIISQVQ